MQQLKPKLRKVPKGWSAYQAAWILDEDAEEGEGDANDMSDTEVRWASLGLRRRGTVGRRWRGSPG